MHNEQSQNIFILVALIVIGALWFVAGGLGNSRTQSQAAGGSVNYLICILNTVTNKVTCEKNPKAPSSAISPYVAHCAGQFNGTFGCTTMDASAICESRTKGIGDLSTCAPKNILEYDDITKYCRSRVDASSNITKISCEKDEFSIERALCRYAVYSNTDIRCEPAFNFNILDQNLGNFELQQIVKDIEDRLKEINNNSVELRNILNRIYNRFLSISN